MGFNDLFDNWYVSNKNGVAIVTKPASPKFRVGLQHGEAGLDPDDADFEHYKIAIEDSNGDFLDYQARSIDALATYSDRVISFGEIASSLDEDLVLDDASGNLTLMGNLRLSNKVDGGPRSPYFDEGRFASPTEAGLSHGNVTFLTQAAPAAADDVLYARPPVEYFDFPNDIIDSDGHYTIIAWAENDDGDRISLRASVVLSVQEKSQVPTSDYGGYTGTPLVRNWEVTVDPRATLTVFGLTVHDN